MFYVFKSTTEKTEAIAEFHHLEQAISFMEYHAIREGDEKCTGYQVEDGTNTLRAEYEL
jgi:hypothetical protein